MTRKKLQSRPKHSKPKSDTEAAVVAAAFRLLASRSRRGVTMASLARATKAPLPDVLALASSRSELVALLLHHLGQETLRNYRPERGQHNVRDRVFDVVMSWFEALNPHKKALRNLLGDLASEPLTLISLRGEALRLSQMLLALAEADAGPSPSLRAAALAAVIARAVPVWLDDGSERDRTMARIDRDLRRLKWLF